MLKLGWIGKTQKMFVQVRKIENEDSKSACLTNIFHASKQLIFQSSSLQKTSSLDSFVKQQPHLSKFGIRKNYRSACYTAFRKKISCHAISPQPNDGQRKPKIFDKGSFTNPYQSRSDPFKLVKVACVYL